MASFLRLNLQSLKERLVNRLGENETFWSDEELQDAINEALCIWQLMTGEFTTTFSRPAEPNEDYSAAQVPKQIMSVQRVKFNGSPLVVSTLSDIEKVNPGVLNAGGTPQVWAPLGLNIISFYPSDNSSAVIYEGLTENFRLLSDGDWLEVGEEELAAILTYAHHYCTFKEGGSELQASSGAIQLLAETAAKRNSRIKESSAYRSMMGLDRDRLERPIMSTPERVGIRA